MKPLYQGKVSNDGVQSVKAPIKTPKSPKPTVKSGSDLRVK